MNWNNSIFNDDRSPRESWLNRDSDTHMPIDRDDVISHRELTNWERDIIGVEIEHFNYKSEVTE